MDRIGRTSFQLRAPRLTGDADDGGPAVRLTGRLLVTTKIRRRKDTGALIAESLQAAGGELSNTIGVAVTHSSDYRDDAPGLEAAVEAVGGNTAVMFDNLGVAVMDSHEDWQERLSVAASVTGSIVLAAEPERFVWAITDYVQGYRDGVDSFASALRSSLPAGRQPAAAALPPERFSDDAQFTWGLRALGADVSVGDGAGSRVAVLDTGVDSSHPDIAPALAGQESFVAGESPHDGHGHGTHCSGTVAGRANPIGVPRFGVAPGASLFAGKVLNNADGEGTDSSILAGIDWAINNDCHVISMSLGGEVPPETPHSPTFEAVARNALDAGAVIVAAAGNGSSRPGTVAPISHPANCPSIIAVGALDRILDPAEFSNAGRVGQDHIAISAPGVDVLSSIPGGGHAFSDGTSMATPHVAGVLAILQSKEQVRGVALIGRLMLEAQGLLAPAVDVGGLAHIPA
ncbi:MAG: S8 family serine peptidase [Acidobacteria bacterium]|nr:S8 family serine peptidase [Acidobacteriota bacterium]